LLGLSELYKALLTNTQEVASLRGETSNQLLDTIMDWNVYLERNAAAEPSQTP
jgi:hypothetical protein